MTMSERELPHVVVPPLAVPEALRSELQELGVSSDALAKLGVYLAQLLAMNELMNLTAITEPELAWRKHIYDSLTLLPHLPSTDNLIDVGSGGGLPALPLAIVRPDIEITLVESTKKKGDFLRAVAKQVGASNVHVEATRAEQLHKSVHTARYGVVTARAVARLAQLIEWTAPFVRSGGTLLFIKGQQADEELKEAATVMKKFALHHMKTETTTTGRIVVLVRTN